MVAEIATIFGPNVVAFYSMLFPGIYLFFRDKKLVYNGNCLFTVFCRATT